MIDMIGWARLNSPDASASQSWPALVSLGIAAPPTSVQADQNPDRPVIERGRHAPMMPILASRRPPPFERA